MSRSSGWDAPRHELRCCNPAADCHATTREYICAIGADIYAPTRTGSDIAFLSGLSRYVIENEKYFRDYVVNRTNAATVNSDDVRVTEDLDGVFSGLEPYTGDPLNGFVGHTPGHLAVRAHRRRRAEARGEHGTVRRAARAVGAAGRAELAGPDGAALRPAGAGLVPPPAERDPTLQNLRCASEKALS